MLQNGIFAHYSQNMLSNEELKNNGFLRELETENFRMFIRFLHGEKMKDVWGGWLRACMIYHGISLKCMESMFPCYPLLNVKVIWVHYFVLINPHKCMSGYLYFPKLKYLFPINSSILQRKPDLIAPS